MVPYDSCMVYDSCIPPGYGTQLNARILLESQDFEALQRQASNLTETKTTPHLNLALPPMRLPESRQSRQLT